MKACRTTSTASSAAASSTRARSTSTSGSAGPSTATLGRRNRWEEPECGVERSRLRLQAIFHILTKLVSWNRARLYHGHSHHADGADTGGAVSSSYDLLCLWQSGLGNLAVLFPLTVSVYAERWHHYGENIESPVPLPKSRLQTGVGLSILLGPVDESPRIPCVESTVIIV